MSDGSSLDLTSEYTYISGFGAELAADASNLTFGTNPAYGIADFLAVYPQFGTMTGSPATYSGPVPQAVLQTYVNLASASLSRERWCDAWQVGMALFIAHFVTLYLQSSSVPANSPIKAIVAAGLARGVVVSKSAGDVSESFENPAKDIDGWAGWKLTTFGIQLLTMARLMGMGGMWIY